MRKIIVFSLSLIIFGCNPFMSKDLKKTIRCNRKLERLIEKCPQLLNKDTIHDTITVTVPEILIKDSFSVRVDTLELLRYITKDQIRYVVKSISFDTIIETKDYLLIFKLSNGLFSHDLIIRERIINKPIETIVNVVKPIELTLFEKVQIWIYGKWWLIPLILICLIIYMVAKRFLKSLPFN